MTTHQSQYVPWLCLIGVGIALLMVRLGNTHLWDQDEGYYAATAAEMLSSNDWIKPTFNGELFGHKPPMMFWGMMLGYQVFGVSELGARFCSSLFGLGTILVTYAIGRRLFDVATGLFAGLAIGSCLMFVMVSRSATADAHLTFFTALALFIWVRGYLSTLANTRDEKISSMPSHVWLMTYAIMGLAVLTKGPIGFLFPTAVIGLFLLTEQPNAIPENASRLKRMGYSLIPYMPLPFLKTVWKMRPLSAAIVVIAIAAPWTILVQWKTDGNFLREFIGVHHFGRFGSAMDNHSGPIYYYILACAIGMYPWSAFAIPTALSWKAQFKDPHYSQAMRFVTCWVAVYLVIFSIASTKLPNYVLPAYPALAIIVGRYFASWTRDVSSVNIRWLHAGWCLLVGVGVVILCAFPVMGLVQYQGQTAMDRLQVEPIVQQRLIWLGVAGLPLVLFGIAGRVLLGFQKQRMAAGAFSLAAIAMIATLCQFVAPELDRLQSSQSLAEDLTHGVVGRDTQITILGHFRPTMVFYLGRGVEFCESKGVAIRKANENKNSILITTDQNYSCIKDQLPVQTQVIRRVAQFPNRDDLVVLGDQSLIR